MVRRVSDATSCTVAVTPSGDWVSASNTVPEAMRTEGSCAIRSCRIRSTVYWGTHCAGSGKRGSRRLAPSKAFSMTARVRPNKLVVNTMSVG